MFYKQDPENQIDISNLTSGVYFLQVHFNRKSEVVRFVKN